MDEKLNELIFNLKLGIQSNEGKVLSPETVQIWTHNLEQLAQIYEKFAPGKTITKCIAPEPRTNVEAPARGAAVQLRTQDLDQLAVDLGKVEVGESMFSPKSLVNALGDEELSPLPQGRNQNLPPPPPGQPELVSTQSFDDSYQIKEEVEQFNNGSKYIATCKASGQEYFSRVYNLTDDETLEKVEREASLLAGIDHPNVITIHRCFEDKAAKQMTLVTEKLAGSVVSEVSSWHKLNERQVRDVVAGMIKGLAYLHSERGVCHRHIHPDTVQLGASGRPEDVRISGFGFAVNIRDLPTSFETIGTLMFAAPEMFGSRAYSEKVDIWSAGVIAFLLLGGYPPFYARDAAELEHRVKTGQFRFHSQFWNSVSQKAKDFVTRMLKVNPVKRSSARELLTHPWIKAPAHVLEAHSIPNSLAQLKKFNAKLVQSDSHHPPHEHHIQFEDQYEKGEKLGEGAFGQVFLCTHKTTGGQYAVKCMDRSSMSSEDLEGLETEIAVMKEINHPHVVRLLNTFSVGSITMMVLELVSGGELFDRIVKKQHYNEKEARDLIRIMLETLHHLHSQGICHRDLKPENLLLTSDDDDADVKIADFGFAVHVSDLANKDEICGTPDYMAPEMLAGKKYDEKVDIWSFGVICFVLLGGYMPFHGEREEELFHRIKCGHFRFHEQYWGGVSKGAKDLISHMLRVNPAQRWSAEHLLAHPWINIEGTVLAAKSLAPAVEKLRKVRMKFKAGIEAVIALNRINSAAKMSGTKLGEEAKEEGGRYGRTHFEDVYDKGDELGRGAFGTVYLAIKKGSGSRFAVKSMDRTKMSKEDLEGLELEVAVMRELNHPHIVRLEDCFVELEFTYLILELVSGGELFDRIVKKAKYTENEAQVLVRKFLETLAFLHGKDICHRDLKPENLLLSSEEDDTEIKIADFGFAIHISNLGEKPEICGSPMYLAPEMVKGQRYNEKVDIWSAGVIIYILLVGYPPFYSENQHDLFKEIAKGQYKFYPQDWGCISNQAKNLIRKMLVVNPRQRASAETLLREPWLQLPSQHLEGIDLAQTTIPKLRQFNARRKLKGAMEAVHAANKMRHLMDLVHQRPGSIS